jgi:hypothetical protein
MGAQNSTPVKNNEKFTIHTEALLVSEGDITPKDRQKAIAYLNGPAFKKRATSDLQSNFAEGRNIKIVIKSIKAQENLKVTIHGFVKVLKEESEPKNIVESVLQDALPQYAAQGEPMPGRSAHFEIRFKSGETSVKF